MIKALDGHHLLEFEPSRTTDGVAVSSYWHTCLRQIKVVKAIDRCNNLQIRYAS